MPLAALKALCRERGLPVSGRKAALRERLEAWEEEAVERGEVGGDVSGYVEGRGANREEEGGGEGAAEPDLSEPDASDGRELVDGLYRLAVALPGASPGDPDVPASLTAAPAALAAFLGGSASAAAAADPSMVGLAADDPFQSSAREPRGIILHLPPPPPNRGLPPLPAELALAAFPCVVLELPPCEAGAVGKATVGKAHELLTGTY
ncbi:hypothetical protein TeGR_g11666, partial [Tetraparma gracilis]